MGLFGCETGQAFFMLSGMTGLYVKNVLKRMIFSTFFVCKYLAVTNKIPINYNIIDRLLTLQGKPGFDSCLNDVQMAFCAYPAVFKGGMFL